MSNFDYLSRYKKIMKSLKNLLHFCFWFDIITMLIIWGRGGTGRRARLRGVFERVWVQVPPSPPNTSKIEIFWLYKYNDLTSFFIAVP